MIEFLQINETELLLIFVTDGLRNIGWKGSEKQCKVVEIAHEFLVL